MPERHDSVSSRFVLSKSSHRSQTSSVVPLYDPNDTQRSSNERERQSKELPITRQTSRGQPPKDTLLSNENLKEYTMSSAVVEKKSVGISARTYNSALSHQRYQTPSIEQESQQQTDSNRAPSKPVWPPTTLLSESGDLNTSERKE